MSEKISMSENPSISGYSLYKADFQSRKKINPLEELFPPLPNEKYSIIYCDPPWDYGGKMQYDKSSIKSENVGFEKNIFISSACFQYPTVKMKDLKKLEVSSIAEEDCLLFMWTTGPQMANAIELGEYWGFSYKTVAFVWDKMMHNPGRYTLSSTEFVLAFKKGKFPQPRGARNIRQLISVKRGKHSEKPLEVIDGITKMFPVQRKIELFARRKCEGWDNWGLEIPDFGVDIKSFGEISK